MYLASIELAMVLSASEMEIRDHKTVPIPNHQKFIGPRPKFGRIPLETAM